MRYITYMDTEICRLLLAEDGTALTEVAFADKENRSFLAGKREEEKEEETPLLKEARRQLEEYFAGNLKEFNLPLSMRGTSFQKQVWEELRKIPYGETVTYGEIAAKIGSPRANRAVGMANHHNPIAIIVPCHRVIGANGKLVGYGGGLNVKEQLLALEQTHKGEGRGTRE